MNAIVKPIDAAYTKNRPRLAVGEIRLMAPWIAMASTNWPIAMIHQ